MSFIGLWHITEMDGWDEDYFNMDVQAYIHIKENLLGSFQFGLVSGQLDGDIEKVGRGERFYFTWDGMDEMEPMSGYGWLKLNGKNKGEGKIKLHLGDSSRYWVKRV